MFYFDVQYVNKAFTLNNKKNSFNSNLEKIKLLILMRQNVTKCTKFN